MTSSWVLSILTTSYSAREEEVREAAGNDNVKVVCPGSDASAISPCIASASSRVTGRFAPTMPPNAETEMAPELVAPMVAFLAHEDCPVTGEIYSAVGGRIARYFVALTPGYYKADLSMEDVRDNFDQIRNEDG